MHGTPLVDERENPFFVVSQLMSADPVFSIKEMGVQANARQNHHWYIRVQLPSMGLISGLIDRFGSIDPYRAKHAQRNVFAVQRGLVQQVESVYGKHCNY